MLMTSAMKPELPTQYTLRKQYGTFIAEREEHTSPAACPHTATQKRHKSLFNKGLEKQNQKIDSYPSPFVSCLILKRAAPRSDPKGRNYCHSDFTHLPQPDQIGHLAPRVPASRDRNQQNAESSVVSMPTVRQQARYRWPRLRGTKKLV